MKKKVRVKKIFGLSVACLFLCCVGWKISQYIIHSQGVVIGFPEGQDETYSEYGFPHYKVFDKNWSEKKLGNSDSTIGEKGDFLCCVCSVMVAAGKNGESTPDRVNALLCELDGYAKNGEIKKSVLKRMTENVKYHNFINASLEDNQVVKSTDDPNTAFDIVKVKKGNDYRWVVIKGILGNDYWCMDPKEEKDTSLSDYESRIYEWYTVGKLKDNVNLENTEIEEDSLQDIIRNKWRAVIQGDLAYVGLRIFFLIIYGDIMI